MYGPPRQTLQLLRAAIEASVYASPSDFGLTVEELLEVGRRVGLKDGEMTDALGSPTSGIIFGQHRRLDLPDTTWQTIGLVLWPQAPERRNVVAFDFVVQQLNDLAREVGARFATINRRVLIERAGDASISRNDIELAIALLLLGGRLIEDGTGLRFKAQVMGPQQLVSQAIRITGSRQPTPKTEREELLPHVSDVIARRRDGRPKHAEPLDAFAEAISTLGYAPFRHWWLQTLNELRRTNPLSSPLAALVLSAALVEAALIFTVKHARSVNLGLFASTDYDKEPRSWKLEDLVRGASGGGPTGIFDSRTRDHVQDLIRNRQRIHAGRMLSEYPTGVPDLNPEQARDAQATADRAVRKILEWLETHAVSVSG